MKLSICTTMTDPDSRNDPWVEAMKCYEELADEVIVTGSDWGFDFSWEEIGQFFQEGFDKCSGDWVIRMDLDYFFRKSDFQKIKKFLIDNEDSPAVAFPQYQIFTPDRYQLKTKLCIALNKKNFPNIKLNGGGDLCQPTLHGNQILHHEVPNLNVPVFQYDSIFRTKEIISSDRARFARAWNQYFKNYGTRGGPTEKEAFDAWFKMIEDRFKFHVHKLNINEHPEFIKDKLLSLTPDQFGYDVFGLKNNTKRSFIHYFTAYKQKYI